MADVRFIVDVDATKGSAEIKKFDDRVDSLGKRGATAAKSMKNLWLQIGIGVGAIMGVVKSLQGLSQWMQDAIDKAAVQETAENDLRAALESTGREVTHNSKHFQNYAKELQGATRFGDEQILNAQALLIQLTKLGRDGLDAATKGAVGLASVYKQDLQAATTLVGKALAGNYGALSRYGIVVEKTMTDEQKRASILEQLGVMYQRAEAETDTFAGRIAQLKNVYGDLKEEIGKAVTANKDLKTALDMITQTISNFIEGGYIQAFAQKLSTIVDLIPGMRNAVHALQLIAAETTLTVAKQKHFKKVWEELVPYLRDADVFLGRYGLTLRNIMPWIIEEGEGQATVNKELRAMGQTAAPIRTAVRALGQFKTVSFDIYEAWAKIPSVMGESIPYYNGVSVAARDMGMVHLQVLSEIESRTYGVYQSFAQSAQDWAIAHEEAMNEVAGYTFDILSQIDAIYAQSYENKMIKLENEYATQVAYIESLAISEDEKNKRLLKLDEDMEKKKREARIKAAKADKAVALMAAIVNVAQGVTKALASAPPPLNAILAAITAALGAIQIGLIASQPIPKLAKGAIFRRPTYMVGDAGDEVLMPLDRVPEIFSKTMNYNTTNNYGARQQRLQIIFQLGTEKLKQEVIDIVNWGFRAKKIHVPIGATA